jgi:squalene synthase HpnC
MSSTARNGPSTQNARIFDPDALYSQASRENFPVASRLLPAGVRAHLMAIYGFARLTDDIGDELAGDRLGALDWLAEELERAPSGGATHPVLRRVGETIAARHLSLQLFRDLIEANRMDQMVRRYETFGDLVEYCRLSANPVGRLVLEVLDHSTDARNAWSDDVCTGLQVVEHLQDVAEDLAQDRVYLPLADLRGEGTDLEALHASSAGPALRRVVALEAARARQLLFSGVPLAASLPWRPRVAIAAFAAGGMAALDAIERAHYDVLAVRCRPRPGRLAARLALVLLAGAGSAPERTSSPDAPAASGQETPS